MIVPFVGLFVFTYGLCGLFGLSFPSMYEICSRRMWTRLLNGGLVPHLTSRPPLIFCGISLSKQFGCRNGGGPEQRCFGQTAAEVQQVFGNYVPGKYVFEALKIMSPENTKYENNISIYPRKQQVCLNTCVYDCQGALGQPELFEYLSDIFIDAHLSGVGMH